MLNIDLEFFFLDIMNRIKEYHIDTYKPGLYFKNNRYPIYVENNLYYTSGEMVNLDLPLDKDRNEDIYNTNKELIATGRQIKLNVIDTVPYLPILPSIILEKFLDAYQMLNNPLSRLYFEDDLNINNENILSIEKTVVYEEDVIDNLLRLPENLNRDIKDRYHFILNKFFIDFMDSDTTAFYKYDFSTIITKVIRVGDLKTIRYDMAVETNKDKKRNKIDDMTECTSDLLNIPYAYQNDIEYYVNACTKNIN